MKNCKRAMLALSLLGSAWLSSGCATGPQRLYQWESYQPQVYEYFKNQGNGVEAQIAILERDIQKIRAKGGNPPPGYHAHLGLLYAHIGKADQFVQQLETEKTLFPESAPYMDFLLKKFKK